MISASVATAALRPVLTPRALLRGDKEFPFKFQFRPVRGDPTKYHMADEFDGLARVDTEGSVQVLGGGYYGDLAVFSLTEASSDVFSIPLMARADKTSFEHLVTGSQISIHVAAEERGVPISIKQRGILKVTDDGSTGSLEVVPDTNPLGPSAIFKVKKFEPTTGMITLVYDRYDVSFPGVVH
jgi:hypothetical protein